MFVVVRLSPSPITVIVLEKYLALTLTVLGE